MKLTADGFVQTNLVDGTTLTGLFNEDGSLNIVLVDGTSVTGLYHACGAYNVVQVDGLTPCGAYAPCGALNVIVGISGTTGRGPRHASGAFLISSALSNAFALLSGEDEGLAFDFTDNSAYIVDTGTPANDYNSTGIVSSGELVGPSGKLTYTSPSNKLTRQADGYYKYQAHNFATHSEDFSSWTKYNAALTSTATSIVESNTTIDQGVYITPTNIVAGSTYVLSFEVARASGSRDVCIQLVASGGADVTRAYFDMDGAASADTVVTSGTSSVSSTTMTDIGGGYYKVTMTGVLSTSAASAICSIFISNGTANGNQNYLGDGSSGLLVRKAHLYRYPANTDYIATTSAAKYALPLEYSATDGSCLGLVVEEQRTGLFSYSADPYNSGSVVNATASSNAATSIFGGTTTASLVTFTGGGSASYVISANSPSSFTSASIYTLSTIVEYTSTQYIQVTGGSAAFGTTLFENFDIVNGVVGTAGVGASGAAGMKSLGNNRWLLWITGPATANSAGPVAVAAVNSLSATRLSAYTASGTTLVWHLKQAELGSFPTSPIVTYGAAATRAADNISIATSAFPYNQPEGTVYSEFVADYTGGNSRVFSLDNGVGARVLDTYYNAASTLTTYNGTNNIPNISYTDGSTTKIAAAYKTLDYGHCANGSAVQLLASATVNTATKLNIGQAGNATAQFCSIIKAISYVPRRKDDIELAVDTGYSSLPTGYASYGAWDLFGTESSALALDFTDQSVVNTKTPLVSQGIVSDGELVGPGAALTYTNPSNKLTMQSDGYYKYQAHNLCLQSENLSTTWINLNTTDAASGETPPSPYTTAYTLTDNGTNGRHILYQQFTLVSGASYTASVAVKAGTATHAAITFDGGSANAYAVNVDLSDGSVTDTNTTGTVTNPSSAVTDLGGGWYRVDVSIGAVNGGVACYFTIGLSNSATPTWATGSPSYAGTGSTIHVTGCALRRTPSNTDYIKTTTAAVYALPIEYDTSGNCLGLLVEEQRTNTFANNTTPSTYMSAGGGTFTDNNATSPTGLTDAQTFVASATTDFHRVFVLSIGGASSTGCTISTYIKAVDTSGYYVGIRESNTSGSGAVFDPSNGFAEVGTYTTGAVSAVTTKVKSVGNGWYRISATFTSTAMQYGVGIVIVDPTWTTGTFLSSWALGSTKQINLWGIALEEAAFPTSPILTYGAAASRLTDDIKIATTAMPWSSTAMSSMAKWTQLHPSSGVTSSIIGADADYIIYTTGTAIRTYDGTSVAASGVLAADNTTFQAASSFENGVGQKITVNGETTQTASFDGTMGSGTSVWIGNRNVLSNAASKIISKILMVPRAKSTSELESDSTQ